MNNNNKKSFSPIEMEIINFEYNIYTNYVIGGSQDGDNPIYWDDASK